MADFQRPGKQGEVDNSPGRLQSNDVGVHLFNDAYSGLRNCGGTSGGDDGPGRGGGGPDRSDDSAGSPERKHHRHNIPNPLPEVVPFVIIAANPGEVRSSGGSEQGEFAEIKPRTSTNANGDVRPGTRVQ